MRPEQSRGWEVGADYLSGDGLRLGLTWFDQRVTDAIEFDLDNFSGYLQQSGRGTSRGAELTAAARLGPTLSLDANYTLDRTTRPNGLPRRYRPERLGNLALDWTPVPALQLVAMVRYNAKPYDEFALANPLLRAVTLLDLSVQYRTGNNLQWFARVDNVLDKTYQEIDGYNTAGRNFTLGVRLRFGSP